MTWVYSERRNIVEAELEADTIRVCVKCNIVVSESDPYCPQCNNLGYTHRFICFEEAYIAAEKAYDSGHDSGYDGAIDMDSSNFSRLKDEIEIEIDSMKSGIESLTRDLDKILNKLKNY